jgi:glycosyltransferase involved in cell wall biosynthesis
MLSVIIPAHNEAALLPATLTALQRAVAALTLDCEVIVVDDASDDGTAVVARAHGAHVLQVAHRQIAATRNAGARIARGDALLFLDADTCVDAPVLAAALDALKRGAVGGGARVTMPEAGAWHVRLGEWGFGWIFRLARIAPGCFLFCTRPAFEATGGFDQRYYAGEDVAMSRALARKGRFVILREPVRTSARKLRTFTPWEHLRLMLRFILMRRRMLTSREHLDFWYRRRR